MQPDMPARKDPPPVGRWSPDVDRPVDAAVRMRLGEKRAAVMARCCADARAAAVSQRTKEAKE